MDTNYILRRMMSTVDYPRKNIVIKNLAVDIQNSNPKLVKRCNWEKSGVYIFIDQSFKLTKYANSPRVFTCHTAKEIKGVIDECKDLTKSSQYILFIDNKDRNYKSKYNETMIDENYKNSIYKRLMEYKKNKSAKVPYYQIVKYSEEILQKLSCKMLYTYDNLEDWESIMKDFIEIWDVFKFYYVKVCNNQELYKNEYLFHKSEVITFYKRLKKIIDEK